MLTAVGGVEMTPSREKMLLSLEGLSIGDAFGQMFFRVSVGYLRTRQLPPKPWRWTDDTQMALSIVDVLTRHGRIDQDDLAADFGRRHAENPHRGYGAGAHVLLEAVARGGNWRQLSPQLFQGGSYGNGGAMRAAPIGGYFAGDPARADAEAKLSAVVTHAHPEGQAGAMAVAAAAALAASPDHPKGSAFIREILAHVPRGETRAGMESALGIPPNDLEQAVHQLGSGSRVSSQDTVPFCLWSAAHHLDDFEEALWWTVSGGGDMDTTCAIVGGIVALSVGEVPDSWRQRREPLPEGFTLA